MTKYTKIYCLFVFFAASIAQAFTDVETVEIELSVKNCNYNAICEPLLGENYFGCDTDCEPPPLPTPTTTPTTSEGNRMGNRRLNTNFSTSNDPLWQINQPFVNDVYIYIKDVNQNSFTVGWINSNSYLNYFKLIKSPFRYPLNDTDGLVVYEGSGKEVGGETTKNLYYYGLFQRIGKNIFVPRIYFTTPSIPFSYSIGENFSSEITPKEFPQQSQTLNVGEIGLFQNDAPVTIGANMAEVESEIPISVLVDTEDDFSSKYNLVGSLNPVLSDTSTIYQFQDAGTGQKIQIPALKTPGDYVLRVTVTSKDDKQVGVSNILIHFDPQNTILGPENYCKQVLISARYLCFTAVGNQLHFLAEKIIKIW